jgi:chaperone LolA
MKGFTRASLCPILIALAVFTSAARAGETKNTAKQPSKKISKETPKVAVSTQAPQASAGAQSQGMKLETETLSELKSWDSRLESLRTRFTQEVNFSDAGLKQRVEGVLSYLKPGLLKIEHIKPARQLIYTDKKELWIYKPEDSQAVRTSWDAWAKNQNGNFSGIMDFGNYAALTEKNTVKVSREKTPPYYITLILTPKSDTGLCTLTLSLSATDYFPAEATLTVENTVIKTRLESTEKNISLDKGTFKFIPPKGTEVLEFNN